MQRNLYTYAYLDIPYDEVAAALRGDPTALLQDATGTASERTDVLSTHLRVDLGAFDVGRDAIVQIGEIRDLGPHAVAVPLRWDGGERGGLFPAMEGFLEAAAIAVHPPATQLSFIGHYQPPLGWIGAIGDAGPGRRIAEMAVHHFLDDVTTRLKAHRLVEAQ